MNFLKKLIFFIFVTLFFINSGHFCFSQSQVESKVESTKMYHFKTKIQEEVWQVVLKQNNTWAKGNPQDIKNFYHENMVAITPGDKERFEGRDACAAATINFAQSATIEYLKYIKPRVDVYGNTAVVTYYYDMLFITKKDGKSIKATGRDMLVFVKEKGKWWAVANQYSPFPK